MIGILFLILHIIVFGAVGFVLGVVFEWQYAKQNTLLDCKNTKLYLFISLILGFGFMFFDELIGLIQFKKLCNQSSIVFLHNPNEIRNKNLIEVRYKKSNVRFSFLEIYYYKREYVDSHGEKYIIVYPYVAKGGWISKVLNGTVGGEKTPFLFSNRYCNLHYINSIDKLYNFNIVKEIDF